MKNLAFDFADMANGDKAVKAVGKLFTRAGTPVVTGAVDARVKRSSGISYREINLTFADGQTVTLLVKQTGDVYQAKLNGGVVPLKTPDDHFKAVTELVARMDAGRAKFQKSLALKKAELPKGIKTAAPKMEAALKTQTDTLDKAIAEATEKRDALKAELGDEAALDGVIEASVHAGKTYYETEKGGVQYMASQKPSGGWEVYTQRKALRAAGMGGGVKHYKTLEELVAANKAFAGLDKMLSHNPAALDSADADPDIDLDIMPEEAEEEAVEQVQADDQSGLFDAAEEPSEDDEDDDAEHEAKETPAEEQAEEDAEAKGEPEPNDGDEEEEAMDSASPNGEWHTKTMAAMREKSNDSLKFIIKDAGEAARAAQNLGNTVAEGKYQDEVHYASMELKRRKDEMPKRLKELNALAKKIEKAHDTEELKVAETIEGVGLYQVKGNGMILKYRAYTADQMKDILNRMLKGDQTKLLDSAEPAFINPLRNRALDAADSGYDKAESRFKKMSLAERWMVQVEAGMIPAPGADSLTELAGKTRHGSKSKVVELLSSGWKMDGKKAAEYFARNDTMRDHSGHLKSAAEAAGGKYAQAWKSGYDAGFKQTAKLTDVPAGYDATLSAIWKKAWQTGNVDAI